MGIGKVDGGWKNRPSEKTQRKISGPGIPALEGLKCLNQVSNILQPQLHDMMRTQLSFIGLNITSRLRYYKGGLSPNRVALAHACTCNIVCDVIKVALAQTSAPLY
jgi:hypothetical protein